jgi:hypothetical protein
LVSVCFLNALSLLSCFVSILAGLLIIVVCGPPNLRYRATCCPVTAGADGALSCTASRYWESVRI